ncbi:MAG: hypothetical protein K6G17_00960 [Oscillospiraceae bacterium]|nr:hypothetical protein [Oscillospiraceae bacterium]
MTEKLYNADSHLFSFCARVLSCEADGRGFALVLDRTAFFPEGGGQPADTGRIGGAEVFDVQEKGDIIYHYVNHPVEIGAEVAGELDAERRLRRMQNHSGEHVVSGLVHRRFGYENVGFHMGEGGMTIDFSGELGEEELRQIERLANEAVRANLPVRAWFPSPEELSALEYRSKKEIAGAVRLVEIKGLDLCACCAPHVSHTGEIGAIKILEAERHRGGMRLTLVCGLDAMEDYARRQEGAAAISRLLSVPRDRIVPAVERLLAEQAKQKERAALIENELARRIAEGCAPREGNIVVFEAALGENALRELVNRLTERCTGFAAAFSGSDEEGYRYVIGSRSVDLRAQSRAINAAIGGRGGGSPEMIQGRASACEADVRASLERFSAR